MKLLTFLKNKSIINGVVLFYFKKEKNHVKKILEKNRNDYFDCSLYF